MMVTCQLLALEIALRLGNDVDMPRNLAKSATVELGIAAFRWGRVRDDGPFTSFRAPTGIQGLCPAAAGRLV